MSVSTANPSTATLNCSRSSLKMIFFTMRPPCRTG
jgi:hypothetical protein